MKIRGSYLVLYSPIITFLLITIFVNIENIYCFFIENPNILTLLCIVSIALYIFWCFIYIVNLLDKKIYNPLLKMNDEKSTIIGYIPILKWNILTDQGKWLFSDTPYTSLNKIDIIKTKIYACINIFILVVNLVILIVYIVSVIITVFINLLKKTINWLDENCTVEW